MPESRVHSERFASSAAQAAKVQADTDSAPAKSTAAKDVQMTVLVDGKEFEIPVSRDEHLLDAALNAGLDLPFSCKAGVCCTCRCKVMEGSATMDKNYTLEADEVAQGYVLSCQARAAADTIKLVLSFDHR